MSLFFIYNDEGLPSNYETVIRDYLNKKFEFTSVHKTEDNKLIYFGDNASSIHKNSDKLQIIWGEVTAINNTSISSHNNIYEYLNLSWNNNQLDNLSNVDGSWGFLSYLNNELYISKGAYSTSSVAPNLYYLNKNNYTYFSTDIELLIPLRESSDFHIGSVLSAIRFGSPSPGNTLIKEIKRIESGYIYKVAKNYIKPWKNIFKFIEKDWWEKYSNNVALDDAINDLSNVNITNLNNLLPATAKVAITMSGGIDSATSAISMSQSKFKNDWLAIYGNKYGVDYKKDGDSLSEKESSQKITSVRGGKHLNIDMMSYAASKSIEDYASSSFSGFCWPTGYLYKILAMAANDNGKDSVIFGCGEDLAPASYIFQESLLEKYLQNKSLGYSNWKLLQKLSNIRIYRGIITRILRRKDLVVDPYGQIIWHHQQINSILLKRFLKNLITDEDIVDSGALLLPKRDLYNQLPNKNVWSHVSSINYDRTFPETWGGITAQASKGTGVKIYNSFAGQHYAKYLIALPKNYKTGKGFPIVNGKDEWNKYLFRKLVERDIGPEVSWRSRYGFSEPLWHEFREDLKMDQVVNDIKIFDSKDIQEAVLKTHPRKHIWTIYSLAKTKENIKSIKKIKL